VSVVTPFYNSEDHLAECIESVLAQVDVDFEYVLVDNQSTDGSAKIARSYAERDHRIRLLATDRFLSQVENYNFALTQITPASEWVKVCQADDWLYPRCLREMVDLGASDRRIGLVSSYSWRGDRILCQGLPVRTDRLAGADACRLHLLEPIFLFGSPTTVMYRADLVRARVPFYELGPVHEDTEACFELLGSVDFGFVHQVLSYRRVDVGSIMGTTKDLLDLEADLLTIVLKYGPRYLRPREWSRRRREALDHYYYRLAQRWLRGAASGTNRGLLDHQRRTLASADASLSYGRLALALGRVVLDTALSPIDSYRTLRTHRPGRPAPTSAS
jgi:glycosyltransferase involved in cell wall biosynthesis